MRVKEREKGGGELQREGGHERMRSREEARENDH